jgi:multimeric flavodoxin WrbA
MTVESVTMSGEPASELGSRWQTSREDTDLKVLAFNCSLKTTRSNRESSTDVLLHQLLDALARHGAQGEVIRAVDYNIKPGVSSDEGDGDDWPQLRQRVLASDIVIIGSPIWLGQPSSVSKRILERMDAFLGAKDERGRMPSYGKVAIAAVVGNEDGAHHVAAELFQALTEVGFSIPPGGATYWVGEAMGSKDYKDLDEIPKALVSWTPMLASNAAHLARLLKCHAFPGQTTTKT